MLENMKVGDVIDEAGTMDELKNACESALPKIKNMLKEEEDKEKLELLNEVKSIIKGVTLKYHDVKHGHYDTHYDVSGKFKSEMAPSDLPPQPISLIDLEDMDSNTSSPTANTTSKNALDELNDIFGDKASISNASTPTADPFDLLSQSIQSNTLPPSSPTVSRLNSSSSSPIAISSPFQHDTEKVQKSSK